MKSPDISILSDEFSAEVRSLPQKNLALELLGQIDQRRTQSAVAQEPRRLTLVCQDVGENNPAVSESIDRNRAGHHAVDQTRQRHPRGATSRRRPRLTDDEFAFYDALEVNDSAVKILGDHALRAIARELVESMHRNVTIDWTLRESARAKLRTLVKRILRKHGYPPDK
jgi:type I restriction enzyme R subunit